jgi:hypothetical protein
MLFRLLGQVLRNLEHQVALLLTRIILVVARNAGIAALRLLITGRKRGNYC